MNGWPAFLESLPWIATAAAVITLVITLTISARNSLALRKERDTLRKADTRAAIESAEFSTLGYHLFQRLGSASVRSYLSDEEVRLDIDQALGAVREYLRDPAASGPPHDEGSQSDSTTSSTGSALASDTTWTLLAKARRDLEMALGDALKLSQADARPLPAGQLIALARQRALLSPEQAEQLRQATAVADRAVHGREVDPDAALDAVATIAACTDLLASRKPATIKPPRKKAASKTVHVVRGNGGWEVRSSGASRAATVRATQNEAVNRARDIVYKAGGGEVVIHGADGRIRAKDTVAARDSRTE